LPQSKEVKGVALAGHSLGAVKAIAYQAEHADPRVLGLALISPPLRPEWDTGRYPDLLAQAEQLVADGKAEELLTGPWIRLSARTLLSTHRFDLDQFGRARPVSRARHQSHLSRERERTLPAHHHVPARRRLACCHHPH
jgi:pimeloyl-ACP methyl ester carboxylesterase